MKTVETKLQFIELRAKNYSYDKIAKALKVSKPTLIEWSADPEISTKINNLRAMHFESVLASAKLKREDRIDFLVSELKMAKSTIKLRNYKKIGTRELLQVIENLETRLGKELLGYEYDTGKEKEITQSLNPKETIKIF